MTGTGSLRIPSMTPFPTIENAVVTTAYGAEEVTGDADYNYCVRILMKEVCKLPKMAT